MNSFLSAYRPTTHLKILPGASALIALLKELFFTFLFGTDACSTNRSSLLLMEDEDRVSAPALVEETEPVLFLANLSSVGKEMA